MQIKFVFKNNVFQGYLINYANFSENTGNCTKLCTCRYIDGTCRVNDSQVTGDKQSKEEVL